MPVKVLRVEPITRVAFAPFGDLIVAEDAAFETVNDGAAQVYRDLARIEARGQDSRPTFNIVRAQPATFPLRIAAMECHPLGSQAFWPLDGAAFLAVVAPAGAFDPTALRAFHCPARQGVNYRPGVWHHALIALHRVSDFIVLDRAGGGENYRTAALAEPLVIESAAPIN